MFMDRRLFTEDVVDYFLYEVDGVVGIVDITQAMYLTKDGDMVPALGDLFSQHTFFLEGD